MPQFSLKTMLLLVSITALVLVPYSFLVRHSATWAPAERAENMMADLYRDACQGNDPEITIDAINRLLEMPKYEFLKQNRDNNVELRGDEIAWFSPNSKYSIGLSKNGSKTWIINGKRAGE